YPAGGTGATRGFDGNHGVRAYSEGDFNAVWAIEVVEAQCPVQVVQYGIREGSCGDGEFRGGCGIRRDLRILSESASLSVLADKCVIPPFGTATAMSGAANRFVVLRDGSVLEPSPVPGKVGGFALQRDDVVRIETAGGGGYGDPLGRDPAQVADDVALGYLSTRQAQHRFGVVLDDRGRPDEKRTGDERVRLLKARTRISLQSAARDEYDGPRRRIGVPADIANRLSVREDSLIELVTPTSAAALRGWVSLQREGNMVCLGPQGLAVLNAKPGDTAEIRAVSVCPK
ncbi:MAG: hydantoinase B/oxoprolinase family protein, partial [Burkholderiales bacterium]